MKLDGSKKSAGVRLIVMEAGTNIAGQLQPEDREQTVLVSQAPGELSVEFAFRVMRRLAAIEASGKRIDSAEMLLRPDADELPVASSALVARAIVQHMDGARSGDLVLVSNTRAAAKSRVLALTEALLLEPGSRNLSIRARFVEMPAVSRRRSGVFGRGAQVLQRA